MSYKSYTSDHVYFNVVITNNSSVVPIKAEFDSVLTSALLDNPSDYYCSIVRFTVPLQQVPIFIFQDGLYSVTISNGATDFQTILTYVPSYFPNLNPMPPDNRMVYSYQQFLDSINNALRSSFIASALPGVAPYMTYDPVTGLFSLNAVTTFHNNAFTDINQPIKVWFNTNLWSFFNNFEKIYNGNSPTAFNTNGKNYNIIIKPTGNNEIIIPATFGGPTPGFGMSQEFQSLSSWNTVRQLAFFTNSIPIRTEAIPNTFNSNSTIQSYQPILTDFQLSLDVPLRTYAQYVPTSEYRLVDMIGTNELKRINLIVFWQDKNNALYPIYIDPLDSLSVKILFRRKNLLHK